MWNTINTVLSWLIVIAFYAVVCETLYHVLIIGTHTFMNGFVLGVAMPMLIMDIAKLIARRK